MEHFKMKKHTHAVLICTFMMSPMLALANDSFYIGAKSGWVHGKNACESHRITCDNDALGGGVFAGYEFRDWLSFEAGYNYFGKMKADYPALANSTIIAGYTGRVQGIELGIKPQYNLSENVSLFAKTGTLAWWTDVKGSEVGYQHNAHDKGWSPMLGVGMEAAISNDLSARVEYQWFHNVGGGDTGGSSINMLTVGLSYHFGTARSKDMHASTSPTLVNDSGSVIEKMHMVLNDMNSKLMFEYNSSELSPQMIDSLQPVLERLTNYPQSVLTIEAHTDSRGSLAYNQKLSEKRALSVNNYLVSRGIAPSRLTIDAKGETQPVADNKTDEGRAQNRRVVLTSPSFRSQSSM
ncbi:OmpA family protein [Aeromonas veronii]|uniref:OmpA family protein n=1 Tax=Aeromonas veronii TaxID=654 RepID=UPI00207C2F50|nr:OmpA family protein [Aeromonas veronii]MCO4174437.1 OmpA family protein [Aeromonas veronii]